MVTRTLRSQLAAIGYRPADVTYVAVSHGHKDHTANLNQFAAATWLTPPAEREFMWKPNNERVERRFYSMLEKSKCDATELGRTRCLWRRQGGDQSSAWPHAGHQVLVLNLASIGRVMIASDLYHYAPEREFHREPPANEFNGQQQSAASRAKIEEDPKGDQDGDLESAARVGVQREAEEGSAGPMSDNRFHIGGPWPPRGFLFMRL